MSKFIIENGILKAYQGDDSVVVILKGVTTISGGVFANRESLTEVHIPESVSYIGENAFAGCFNLKIIHFPKGLRNIERTAFGAEMIEDEVVGGDVAISDIHYAGTMAEYLNEFEPVLNGVLSTWEIVCRHNGFTVHCQDGDIVRSREAEENNISDFYVIDGKTIF